jgi:hypothetical protein
VTLRWELLDAIPAELRDRPQWVVWRSELVAGRAKPTKVPYRADEPRRHASSTEPATWAPFRDAVIAAWSENADGVGFVFAADDPYCGVDVDDLDAERKAAIVAALSSYTERSVSGTGLHVVVRANLNGAGRHPPELGIFDHGRYFVMTGDHLDGTPATIEPRQAELEAVLANFLPAPAPQPSGEPRPIELGDHDLLARALYEGRWQELGYPSQSEADLALCTHLAFWSGRDAARIDALFRTGGLMRPKWERDDYRERTIDAALTGQTAFYEPRATQERPASPSSRPMSERLRVTVIGDVKPKRIVWLEDGLVARGMLTGLVAPGGTVKGLYGIHLAAKLAERGERTLFLCSEDALDYIIRPRFEAAGCDGKLAFALSIETATGERALHFPSDLPVLAEAIAKVEPRLVIVDPVASYIDAGLDMAKNNQMRQILQPLITLAAGTETAIIPVYHLGKERGRGAIGSVAFEDACRQVLTAARDDDDEDVRHLELTKTNIGRTGYGRKLRIVEVPLTIDGETVNVAKLVDEGRSSKSVHALLDRKGTPGPDRSQRESARDLLCELLAAGEGDGVAAGEVRERVEREAGVSQATIWRAFNELRDEGLVGATPEKDEYGTIRAWFWYAKAPLLVGRGDG